jgi:ATP-binding cassette subfamily B multidrug efflux pump
VENIRILIRYFSPYRWDIVWGVTFIFFSMLFSLTMPLLVGWAIDDLGAKVTWQKVVFYPLAILAANLISGIFLFWQRRLLINASRHMEYDIRRDYYAHLVDQPLSFFHGHRIGDLMARATNDLAAVRQIMGPMILYSFQAIFALVIALPVLMRISVELTLLLLLTMPLVSLTVKFLGQQIHVRFEKIQEYFSHITARAQENLSGVRVVRAYAQEAAEVEDFQELNREYAKQNLSLVKYSVALRPLMFFEIGLGFVIIFFVGIPMAVRGEISAGDFAAFNLYLQRMIWNFIAFGYVVNLYQRGTASLKRINQIIEIKPAIEDAPEVKEQPPIRGKIEFRHLNFNYNDDTATVLKDINLTIEPGETVAFVGKTGSGKSTIVSLIPRLIDAPPGTVFIDGVSVRDYPLRQLRSSIGAVPQESFLFSDTLAENISFGVTAVERSQVEQAAETAGLIEDIENFPSGFEQLVGERGITLSGGQKQRTSIARAVIRNPRILILDDSLSAVDTYTEEQILHRLREVRKNRTTLVVSHRISTVRDADLICVMKDGRIFERGTHDELLRLGGEYADLYKRQLLEEELAATA